MKRVIILIGSCGLMMVPVASAGAGTCGDEIAKLEAILRGGSTNPYVGPSQQQSVGAQLHHQPTPGSVRRAEAQADRDVAASLERARDLDAAGKEADCLRAVGETKRLLGLD
jgi:hypothetical protein